MSSGSNDKIIIIYGTCPCVPCELKNKNAISRRDELLLLKKVHVVMRKLKVETVGFVIHLLRY